MSVDFEQQLRESLQRRGASPQLTHPDPLTAFTLRERRHRQVRRTRWAAVGLGSAALVAAVGAAVIALPDRPTAVEIGPAHSRPVPTIPTCCIPGSLGGDTGWLQGLREAVQGINDAQLPNGQTLDDTKTDIRYAGRLDGVSMALVTVTTKGQRLTQWFGGPADARPGDLTLMAQAPSASAVALTSSDAEGQGHLVVIASYSSQIRISLGVTYEADGSVRRTFTTPTVRDGMATVKVPPPAHPSQMRVVVTYDGRTLFDGAPINGGWPETLITRGITQALTGTRGLGATEDVATRWVSEAAADAGVDPLAVQFSIPWAGTFRGQPAGLVKLTTPGGGTLFYVVDGKQSLSQLRTDLRLVVPAQHADQRPIGWRLPAAMAGTPDEVAVLTPPGTARAEVVTTGTTIALDLDQDGFATADVPRQPSSPPVIRAYDSAGTLLGETLLPPGAALFQQAGPGSRS